MPLFALICTGNEFDLLENEPIGGTHFDMNDFPRRPVFRLQQKATRKCAY